MRAPETPGTDGFFYRLLDNKCQLSGPESVITRDPSSRYDPGVNSVIIGTTTDKGSLFAVTHGARTLSHWQPFLNRWIDLKLHREVEAIYGTPQMNDEARALSTKMLGMLSDGRCIGITSIGHSRQ